MTDISAYNENTFESIKHYTDEDIEFWYARELQVVLEYTQWRRFSETIERAKTPCENSGNIVSDHFAEVGKMVGIGSGAEREVEDYMLSRYACYPIVQPAPTRKKEKRPTLDTWSAPLSVVNWEKK